MVKMVDVSPKTETARVAVAEGTISLSPATVERIRRNDLAKGDVASAAQLAGILAAKETPRLLPLCHPIPVESTDVELRVLDDGVKVTATVRATAKTGVEMEALAAVTVALLNVWDMTKMYEKDEDGQYPRTKISDVRVTLKKK
ncbi:MAG: cyclic pyranopterin monophosphate synthase MoaC [Promethearchaeota archaeon]